MILTINDLKLKLDGQQKEIVNLCTKLKDSDMFRGRIRQEIAELAGIGNEPKLLREASKRLYQKHVKDDARKGSEGGEDLQKESNRQRDYLERTVESLKKKLVKDADTYRADATRIMSENVLLIQEINQLRREVKMIKAQSMNRDSTTTDLPDHLRNQMASNKEQIARLRDRLSELDRISHSLGRPVPKDRAPGVA